MLVTLFKNKTKFWKAVLAYVNFILKDELAQLVGTLNKWDQVHYHRVIQLPGETVSFAYPGWLSGPRPVQMLVSHPSSEGLGQTEFKSMQIHYHPGKPVEGLAKLWQHCCWYASLALTYTGSEMRVPLFSCCSMGATDPQGFFHLREVWGEKKPSWAPLNILHEKLIRFALLLGMRFKIQVVITILKTYTKKNAVYV